MSESIKKVEQAAKNILFNCAKGQAGDTLLIVHEACDEGYYDPKLHGLIADQAKKLGFKVTLFEIAFAPDIKDPSPELATKLAAADHSLFRQDWATNSDFRRIRFPRVRSSATRLTVICFYPVFARADYAGFAELKGS